MIKMNPDLDRLHIYPFEKLRALTQDVTPPPEKKPISMSIGEPKHAPPSFVLNSLVENLDKIASYPTTKGLPELRTAIARWAEARFQLKNLCGETQVLPVNGTREALFAFAQACIDRSRKDAAVMMPNPFYQIYEGAALLAGAETAFLNCTNDNNFIADFDSTDEKTLQACQLVFICSPGNPTGAVMSSAELQKVIALADKYDFIVASDECYSELYFDEANPPCGLLQACADMGRNNFERCVVFHSLSKRSNLPGLRSGFVAGDKNIIGKFLHYRTYHGCAMPLPAQLASTQAWLDESHVQENRQVYTKKFAAVVDILKEVLPVSLPDAGFYLWPETPIADTDFARALYAAENVMVLPGSFLARDTVNGNPGSKHVRIALVAAYDECVEAAHRIKRFVQLSK